MTTTMTPPEADVRQSLDERIADICGQLNACHGALVDLVAEAIATDAWQGWGIRLDRPVDHLAHRHVRRTCPLAGRSRHRFRVAPEDP